ncbi:MAG: hypothetical protein HUU06_07125, partial [Planctomycetaceae bacterium]|nr:hypothetical protein [Planctomycetaceae bacterium]
AAPWAPLPSRAAEEGTPPALSPAEAYEARLRSGMAQVGGLLEPAASFAMSNKLKRTGIGVFRTILEFDPSNQRARRELGYEKKGEEWVLSESKKRKVDDLEDESSKKLVEFQEKLDKANLAVAGILAELGDLADRAGEKEKAQAHWKRAILLDDQNPVANRGMGHKLVNGKWLSQRAINHDEFWKVYKASLEKAQKMAVTPVSTDATTGIAEDAGIPVKRYATKNFRIESTLPDGDIRDTLVWLERARSFFIDLYGMEERHLDYEGNPLVYVIGTTDEQKNKFIDACKELDPAKKAFNKKFGGVEVNGKLKLAGYPNGETAQRECLHSGTHSFVRDTFGQHAAWLWEALANSVSAALKGADLKVCFSGEGSTGGIHLENIGLETAPQVLRDLVVAKKDTPIGEFVKLPSDGLTAQQIAKSWSIVMFLLETDRVQARDYFAAAGQGQAGANSKEDRVLAQYFEAFPKWEALDAAWREWALDVYRKR